MTTEEILLSHKPHKDNLIQILHEIQDAHPQQYLPETELMKVAKFMNLSMSSVYGVVAYYTMFSTKPRGKYIVRLCESPVCEMLGSEKLAIKLKEILKINFNETTADGFFTLESSECIGLCGNKPAMMINKNTYTDLSEEVVEMIISNLKNK